MLVSHTKKFIYTKTVKTAGTSVELYFEPYCTDLGTTDIAHLHDELCSENGIVGYRGYALSPDCRWWNHMPAKRIREQVGTSIWDTYFKFCVIRNPYEKLVSAFHFKEDLLISVSSIPLDSRAKLLKSLFHDTEQEFLDALNTQLLEERFRTWILKGGMVNDRDKYLIDGSVCVDYFIRFENLLNDIQFVCNQLNIPYEPTRLQKLKGGKRPDSKPLDEYYDAQTAEIVLENYRFEIEFFGYLPPPRLASKLLLFYKDSSLSLKNQKANSDKENEVLHSQVEVLSRNCKELSSELDNARSAAHKTRTKLQKRIKHKRLQLERQQKKLELLNADVAAMRSSKFWKLRSLWLRCKQRLGFKGN